MALATASPAWSWNSYSSLMVWPNDAVWEIETCKWGIILLKNDLYGMKKIEKKPEVWTNNVINKCNMLRLWTSVHIPKYRHQHYINISEVLRSFWNQVSSYCGAHVFTCLHLCSSIIIFSSSDKFTFSSGIREGKMN